VHCTSSQIRRAFGHLLLLALDESVAAVLVAGGLHLAVLIAIDGVGSGPHLEGGTVAVALATFVKGSAFVLGHFLAQLLVLVVEFLKFEMEAGEVRLRYFAFGLFQLLPQHLLLQFRVVDLLHDVLVGLFASSLFVAGEGLGK
jgi:hypothetical protein